MTDFNKVLTLFMTGAVLVSCQCGGNQCKTDLPVFSEKDMDISVAPGHNFYLYANGGWMKNNPVPADKSRYGAFDVLDEDNDNKVKSIIVTAAEEHAQSGTVSQQIGDFYASGMDSLKVEQQGIEPLKEYISMIDNISNQNDLIQTIGKLNQIQLFPLFYYYGEADMKNSDMTIAIIYQNGLGMPDRDYYTDKGEQAEKVRTAYDKYLTSIWLNMGNDSAASALKAKSIIKFETRMAEASNTMLENRDPQKTYNKLSYSAVKEMAPQLNWDLLFTGMEIAMPTDINVYQPKYLTEIGKMINEEDIEIWKIYLTTHLVRQMAPYLPSKFVDANFEFYGKALSGQQTQEPRWRRVLNTTSNALGEAIGQLFVKQFFPPEAKTRMENLVENLRIAFGQRIEELDWMSDSTKIEAQNKLAAIKVKIGYPNKWRDYSSLKISAGNYAGNVLNSNKIDFLYNISKIGKPVDKDEWHMTPQTVNAYYNPSANEIVFPAAILQPPFFYLKGDDAVNYGAIGVVIGHEMTHGFDDQGRQFDKTGNLNDWWKAKDAEQFNTKTKVLVDLFDSFVAKDTVKANGKLTLGENIADLGGLYIAHQAFRNTLKGQPEPEKMDGFSADQRFYLSYARIWAQTIRDEEVLRRVKVDVHSLGEHRVNGPLPNIESFVKAFDVKESDSLYIATDNRAKIW